MIYLCTLERVSAVFQNNIFCIIDMGTIDEIFLVILAGEVADPVGTSNLIHGLRANQIKLRNPLLFARDRTTTSLTSKPTA